MRVHSRQNSNKKKTGKIIGITILVILFGLIAPRLFTEVSRIVFYPVHVTNTWFRESSGALPMYFKERAALMETISDLENRLAIAQGTSITQQRLYEENNWLRQLLNVEADERIAAAVIARPNDLPYDFLQIDRGSDDGVLVGAPVYIGIDNVIGIVSSVDNKYAFVQLFTSPNFEATAFISGPDVVAVVEGYGSGVARVKVPQGVALSIGNVVHLPSIQPGAFGRIAYIESAPSQPEQFGYITLQKPIHGIQYVAVGTSSLSPTTPNAVSEEIREIIKAAIKVPTADVIESLGGTTSSTTEFGQVELSE